MRLTQKTASFYSTITTRTAIALVSMLSVCANAQPDTLRKLAELRGIYVGAAVTSRAVLRTPSYDSTLARNFNGLVPENAMKFGNVAKDVRGVYDFTTADAIVKLARDNGMRVRGHTLVWHTATPIWFNNLSGEKASRDTTLRIMREHIDTVMGRYRGNIYEWDVVNEAILPDGGEAPGYRDDPGSRWYNRTGGIDHVDSAFKWAHLADTGALLFYNDFNGEGMNQKSQNIYDLVTGLKDRGAPIHGVGLQCHLWLGNVDTAAFGRNMRRLAAQGFVISLTEVNVEASSSAADLATQKARYKALAKLCLSVPACKSFYTWGLNDPQSYRGEAAAALMFSGADTLVPKPAYWGVVEALAEGSTETSVPSAPWNVVAMPIGDGSMAVQWMPPVTDGRLPITGYKVMAVADTSKSCIAYRYLSCVVSGLGDDTTHRFTVRAYNAKGASGKSPYSTRAKGAIALPSEPDTAPIIPGEGRKAGMGSFVTPFSYQLALSSFRSVERMTMVVMDASGRVVWSESVQPATSWRREITWNGVARTGVPAPTGVYMLRVRMEQGGRLSETVSKGVLLRSH